MASALVDPKRCGAHSGVEDIVDALQTLDALGKGDDGIVRGQVQRPRLNGCRVCDGGLALFLVVGADEELAQAETEELALDRATGEGKAGLVWTTIASLGCFPLPRYLPRLTPP